MMDGLPVSKVSVNCVILKQASMKKMQLDVDVSTPANNSLVADC